MVVLCNQLGVEIKVGLNIASEGLNHQWGERAKCGASEGKGVQKEIAKFLVRNKIQSLLSCGGDIGKYLLPSGSGRVGEITDPSSGFLMSLCHLSIITGPEHLIQYLQLKGGWVWERLLKCYLTPQHDVRANFAGEKC